MQKSNRFAIILESRASDDFWQAFLYYENISEALSENFRSLFELAIEKLSRNPHHYFKLTKKLRRIRLGKFPYLIVYKINSRTKTVTVLGLFHSASRPSRWRRRKR